jgi:hypothetical protein
VWDNKGKKNCASKLTETSNCLKKQKGVMGILAEITDSNNINK